MLFFYFLSGSDAGPSMIFVLNADGSGWKALSTPTSEPVWSPDGRQIMLASGNAIYAMNADGSGVVQLTSPPLNSWDGLPAWRR